MTRKRFHVLAACGLLLCQSTSAQLVPAVQNAIERSVEQVQNTAVDRTLEQVQNRTAEQVVQQAAAAVDSVATDLIAQQQVDNVQSQAAAQVQNSIEQAQAQAAEQAQAQVERLQNQVERAQEQVGQVQSQVAQVAGVAVERLQDRVVGVAPGVAAQVEARAVVPQTPVDQTDVAADAASSAVAAAVPDDAGVNTTSPRQTITNTDGTQAFVEITLEPGVRAVEFEWIMVVTDAQRARLDTEAAELLVYLTDTEPFALTEGQLLTFNVPPDLDANDAIRELVPANMRDLIDRNHIYDTQDDDQGGGAAGGAALLPWPMSAVCAEPVALGMIDSAVDATHPAFAGRASAIHNRSFVDSRLAQPPGHGTAVAGLLIGKYDGERAVTLRPLLPQATLYSAAVFHEQEGVKQGATVLRILEALDWLVSAQHVQVVNMSLAGPPNRLLAQAITAVTLQGKIIVAAAGNEGPYGPERYPAAYEDAIGVTAVGRDTTIFRFANQGAYIDYAALGVDVLTALGDGRVGRGSGTSLAAPVVSAFLACALARDHDRVAALAALDHKVRDLGLPGPDPVYGRGLLHPN